MSEEYGSLKLLPWSGRQEDWRKWSTKFMMRGTAKGYGRILKGIDQVPASDLNVEEMREASEEVKKATRKLLHLNDEGFADLVMAMDDSKSFNIVMEHENDLYGAWKALSKVYDPSSGTALVRLLGDFTSARIEDVKQDIGVYISEMEIKRRKLYDMGHKIDDKTFMTQILASLPKEYVLLTAQLKREIAKDQVSFVEMREELKNVYMSLKMANGWNDEEIALNVQTKNLKFKEKIQGTLYSLRKARTQRCRLLGTRRKQR